MPVKSLRSPKQPTISKNGKRVPASTKGKAEKPKRPRSTVEYNGKKVDGNDKQAVKELVSEVVRNIHADAKVDRVTGEVVTPSATPLLRITCPTAIGKVTSTESSRYSIDAVAIMADNVSGDHVFLAATDGRMLAIVRADFERAGNVEGAGLDAQWLPRDLATPGAAIRLAKGQTQTLFGEGLHWVDDQGGLFQEQPGGGAFPPIVDLLPEDVEGCVCVRLNTKLLGTLAKALNDGQTDIPEGLTLFIRQANPGEMVSRPLVAVGNRGMGVLMPAGCASGDGATSAEAAERWYKGFRRDFLKGRPKPKPTENVEEVLNPEPADAAQQVPSNAPAETDDDDGRDAPSSEHPTAEQQAEIDAKSAAKSDRPWYRTDVGVLKKFGVTDAILTRLDLADITTLGDLDRTPFDRIEGLSPTACAKIEEAFKAATDQIEQEASSAA